MNSLALSPQEVAVLHAARKSSPKQQIVSMAMALTGTGDAPSLSRLVDRLVAAKLLAKTDIAQYELTEPGHRALGDALRALDKFVSSVRYGVRA